MGILYDLKNLFKSAPPLFQAMEPQCVRYEWFTMRLPERVAPSWPAGRPLHC